MKAFKVLIPMCLLCLLVLACAPKVVEVTKVVEKERVVEKVVKQTVVVEKVAEKAVKPQATAASGPAGKEAKPGATAAPEVAEQGRGLSGLSAMSYQAGRKIIKDGKMDLVVADTDEAVDEVTLRAVTRGGYLIALETYLEGGFKFATIALGVPVEEFENLQRDVRAIALRVLKDSAIGVDVTDEYVDTQSRLANLEATQARIRQFLEQATTVEESLKVNEQLAEIEAEIEKVKGRLNFLKDRAAYSTLTVNIQPERPTPTPTFTPSPTPTATPTSTPTATPTLTSWKPGETFKSAAGTLSSVVTVLVRVVGNVVIYLMVVVLPIFSPVLLVGALIWWLRRNKAKKPQ
jgi:uncharacterized coiled-coil protein SlyX